MELPWKKPTWQRDLNGFLSGYKDGEHVIIAYIEKDGKKVETYRITSKMNQHKRRDLASFKEWASEWKRVSKEFKRMAKEAMKENSEYIRIEELIDKGV